MLRLIRNREGVSVGGLALFTSFGTLLCCALPILLVSVGLGSVVASVTLQLPFLVVLSEYKAAMFAVSAVLLAFSGWLLWARQQCPADPLLAERCRKGNLLGKRIFWIALAIWTIGLFASYLLLPLRQWLDF